MPKDNKMIKNLEFRAHMFEVRDELYAHYGKLVAIETAASFIEQWADMVVFTHTQTLLVSASAVEKIWDDVYAFQNSNEVANDNELAIRCREMQTVLSQCTALVDRLYSPIMFANQQIFLHSPRYKWSIN